MAEETGITPMLDDSGELVWIVPLAMYLRAVRMQLANGVLSTRRLQCIKIIDGGAVLSNIDIHTYCALLHSLPTPAIEVKTDAIEPEPIAKLEPAPMTSQHEILDLTLSPPSKKRAMDLSTAADNLTPPPPPPVTKRTKINITKLADVQKPVSNVTTSLPVKRPATNITSSLAVKQEPFVKLEPIFETSTEAAPSANVKREAPHRTINTRSSPPPGHSPSPDFVDPDPSARAVPPPSPPPRRVIDLRSRSVRVYRF